MAAYNESLPQATEKDSLLSQVRNVVEHLPQFEYLPRISGEIDYYGASHCIAQQLGLKKPLFGQATWMHGWGWHKVFHPDYIVSAESVNIHNLVRTKAVEEYLKGYGFPNAVATGLPILYAPAVDVPRIPDSILVMPTHVTQCCPLMLTTKNTDPYVRYVQSLRDEFSLVTVCLGAKDVRRGNWTAAFEEAGIPWITGAWIYDRNALVRVQALMRQFEYVTTNAPGSHIAYSAYCGCKVSFTGPECDTLGAPFDTHPFYKQNPHLAAEMKKWDLTQKFASRFPFFRVAPKEATIQTEWANKELGVGNKKQPEEIAELFGWKIRKLSANKWAPVNAHDMLTHEEIFAKAMAKSMVSKHEDAFKFTNILKRRHVRMLNTDVIRARYFLSIDNQHGAREAVKEELRHYPDNKEAADMLQKLGGDILTPHVAKNEDEKEFVDFLNTVRPYTRLNFKRAKSLYDMAVRVCKENRPGNIVECGVAAGGSTMLLALVVQKHSKIPRKVFAFDTFTGMPDPDDVDTNQGIPADETGWGTGTCAAPEEFVQANCRKLGLQGIVETRKGLFDVTLPKHRSEIGEISLLHMDADWYSSTMTILDNLFDQLSHNALIQIDDYRAWDGCKMAIQEYSAQHNLFFEITEIDGTGVWCTKPAQAVRKPDAGKLPFNDAFLAPKLTPEFADLYLVRSSILNSLEQAIPSFSGTLLDVGCGQMPYREHILQKNTKVEKYIGLDFATGKYANRKQPDITWDGTSIPLPDGSVDCAMATEVLEHCHNPLIVLKEIRRVLAPGGTLFFTTPFLWPIHDAPYDHYRYTPYAMEQLLEQAGFEDINIAALGGWDAALAQMIGLWLRRAPMPKETREQLTSDLYPFFTELIRTDTQPDDFARNPMLTGLSGTARTAGNSAVASPDTFGERVIVITDQFPVLSQTFILDQMIGLLDRGVAIEHWSLQHMEDAVVHEKIHKYGLVQKTHYVELPPESFRSDPLCWTEHFLNANNLRSLKDVAAVQVHFGPNFNKFAPLFKAFPEMFVMVSFHGYDGSATLKIKGKDIYKELFARANMITTPSFFMKNNLVEHSCPPDKIVVHHYGKDTSKFAPVPKSGAKKKIRILSIARFVEKKGLEYSIAAFAKAQAGFDVQYRIVGYGPLQQELTALAESLGVSDKIVFLGQLSGEQVLEEMKTADIFALTSVTASNGDEEGVPVSLIEAQAFGLPVVSSQHAGIPELISHGKSGFLAEERNVDEIAGYMRALIKNIGIRSAFSTNAREHVLREFDLNTLNSTLARYLRNGGKADVAQKAPAPPSQKTEAASENEVFCPVCGNTAPSFKPFGNPPRPNALCPNCTSLERHRFLWAFLENNSNLFTTQSLNLLHFASEVCLEWRLRSKIGRGYITADLLDPKADVKADITSLNFADASFDAIICSHVLEHVPDDQKAMQELFRVLSPGGTALVMVPLKQGKTEEDLSITDPAERTRRYGQSDHVRYYGIDIAKRLRSAGFVVQLVKSTEHFSAIDMNKLRLNNDCIFLCTKPKTAKNTGPRRIGKGYSKAGPSSANTAEVIAKHWANNQPKSTTRWWMHPAILQHVNTVVCGKPVAGPWAGLKLRIQSLVKGGIFARGISVGCGNASKELSLLEDGIVGHFDLFELSADRVLAGKKSAQSLGLEHKVSFYEQNPFEQDLAEPYDLVYWNNALHHMFDVHEALKWSRELLRPGGWLVVDDYVGATRFQWPDSQLQIASRIRKALPQRLLRAPGQSGKNCSTNIVRPSLTSMLNSDPSEAADSDNIIPALQQVFPDVDIVPTGGVIYNLALQDIIANFDDVYDAALLQDLLNYDAALASQGQTQYACAFASKPSGTESW